MCIEIEKYKQEHNYDFSNYFDSSQIDDDAEALLNDFLSNPNYNLKLDKRKVPIIELAKIMGKSIQQNSKIEIFQEQLVFLKN